MQFDPSIGLKHAGTIFTHDLGFFCTRFEENQQMKLHGSPTYLREATALLESGRPAVVRSHSLLIVDDDEDYRHILARLLEDQFDIRTASSGEEALDLIREMPPNLILADINMPGISGIEFARRVRLDPRTERVPIILITAMDDPETMVTGLEAGATDYITKPFSQAVLLARIHAHIRNVDLQVRLENQNEVLAKLAALDDLTGAYNRRTMVDALEAEISRSLRYRHGLAVVMMDIDHFKSINDKHGHAIGDHLLRGFVKRINLALRATDIFCRYGGEEFCLIMPETDEKRACRAAERMRQLVRQHPFRVGKMEIHMTVSMGMVCMPERFKGKPGELVEQADKALYEAKRSGRDRLFLHKHQECHGEE